uniref:periplasmic flagellar collar protein FlcA n=1 Tax=uncultured Brachyspira sp. TaxID=221953 RepID=UPI00263043CB
TTEDEKVSVDTDNLDLPEDLDTTEDEKVSVDTDDLDLPEDLDTTEDEKVSVDTDDLDLPEDLDTTEDEKVSVDTDDLDLPEDLDNIEDEKVSVDTDDLDLPEDLDNTEDEKVSVDTDDLDLPEDLDNIEDEKVSVDTDDLDLPEDLDNIEDEKVSVDTDDLDLPEDLDIDDDLGLPEDLDIDDDKISGDLDSLDLPEDQELEDKIAMDINDSDSKSKNSDIKSDKLPVLDDLPLLDTLPNIDDDYVADSIDSDSDEMPEIKDIEDVSDDNDVDDILNSLDMDDISDSLDDILDEEEKGEKAPEEEPIPESKSEEPESKADDKEEEDDDLSLDNLIPEEDEEKEEEAISESKSEEPESKADDKEEDDDDLSLDNLIPEEDEEKEEEAISESKSEEPASKSDDKEEDDDLSLDNLIPEEEEKEEAESKSEEPESKSDDKEEEGDDLSLDNLIPEEDEEKEEESESKEEETESKEKETSGGDVDLDNLTLDDIDDTDNKSNEEETHDEDNHHDDLDLPDEIEDTLSDVPSTNIIEGGTTLPAPETSNSLVPSKYDDVDKDVDHDKVINAIKYLPPITQYHVLDAILNEKISRNSMEDLLNALERGESSENIANILNKELGLSIREDDRKNVLDLIPIPNSLKDYARIIRVAAVFLILFLAIVVFSFQFIYKPIMANKYYKQGLVSISNGAYDEAERNFAQGERLKPKQTKWYNRYARAYIARETFPNALNKIQGALNIKPRDFETRITYGFYYRKKGEKELSEEDYIAGEELYNDMLVYTKKKKEQKVIYDERGVLMISRAKNLLHPEYYDLAYNNYSDMINFFGDDVIPRKRTMLIRIYQDNYQHVKALQNHIENLKKGYIDDDVYPKLAKYLLDKDDFYGSRTLFEKLLAAYPSNLESIVGYADYETRLKHYDRAMEILTTAALPLYSKDPFYRGKEYVYNMLGQIYYNLGEYGNAVKNFNEALSINSVYPDANYNLGNVYFYQDKDYVKAKEYYQMAYDNLAPNLRSDQLLYNLSWIYYLDSEFDRAFEGFNALFQKNPSNSVVSYALGNSLLHLDKANLANGFYRNALSQVLSKRDKLGRLEMRTESDFILISYLASLYNNIGVSYAYNSTVTNTIQNEQEAFKHFVLASEYFDQVRTSNIDLERMEKRTVMVDNQNVGAAAYNIMAVQGKRNLKAATIIDDYIPKDMYYLR